MRHGNRESATDGGVVMHPNATCWIWARDGRLYCRWKDADDTAHESFLRQFGSRGWNMALRAWGLPLTEARAVMDWASVTFGRVNLRAPASRAVTARKAAS
jgi:hypothetical protein